MVRRGGVPIYSQEETGDALVIGQSCQRPDRRFDISRARWHVGAVPRRGLLTGGEVLINSTGTGTLGRVALTHASFGEVTFADTHVTVVRPDPALADARYIAYVLGLDSFARLAEEALSVGATKQKELNVEALRNHMILVPDYVRSQAVIADFLDRERQRIDSARMSALKLAADAETELSKRVHHLLDQDAEASVTPRLRWVAAVLSGFAFPSDRFVHGSEVTVRLLRGVNVGVGTTRWDDVVGWDPDDVESYARWRLRRGDVVVGMDRPWISAGTRVATLGDSDLPALLLQRVACIRPRGVVSADYLRLWLEHPRFSAELAGAATGVSVPHISGDQIGAFRVPVPDVARQGEVVAHSTSAARYRELLDVVATRLASLLDSYRDSLIHEAVTGKLDVTKVSDRQMDERLHAAAENRLDEVAV
jgi:type I restriction enzyme S subunit